VTLAESNTVLGGRVTIESTLPGLSTWARVGDYRINQLRKMTNVEIYLDSELTTEHVLEFQFDHVVIATGARWTKDALDYHNGAPASRFDHQEIYTPDDVLAGTGLTGPVVVFDFDHYYMGGALAEKLRLDGHDVTLVTPASEASAWTHATDEQFRIQVRLLHLGVRVVVTHCVTRFDGREAELACVYTDRRSRIPCASLVVVGIRRPNDALYKELVAKPGELEPAGIKSIRKIGDCAAPGAIVHAVYDGHRYARELDTSPPGLIPFRREPALGTGGYDQRGGIHDP
jgi:dimethylamine/trimethylamine dehydrogenase